MNQDTILAGVIEGYRDSIRIRYQYDTIKEAYDIPDTIHQETITQLREYFLDYLYPPHQQRTELNEAFKSLDEYIKNPQKLVRVAFDAAKLFFKYGRHLPKILSAGLGALKTFRAATTFEDTLVSVAVKKNIAPPFTQNKIDTLMTGLSKESIEEFIENSQSLFELLHKRALIDKIKEVIDHLILAMRKNEKAYTLSQIKGLELGLKMIQEGDTLFYQLSKDDQRTLIITITKIERDNLNRIFKHVD